VTCDDARLSLGVYVLGSLDEPDRTRLLRHLRGCAACRDELADLAPLPALLGRLTPLEAATGLAPEAPADGYQRLVARAGRDGDPTRDGGPATSRPRRARRRWLAVAAAVAVLSGAGGGTAWWESNRPDAETYTAASGPVRMVVELAPQPSGSALDVTVSGLKAGQQCRLVAVDEDGARHVVGTWEATSSGEAWARSATAVPLDRLMRLDRLDAEGRPLATVRP
jgi:anti-sigma factor RsiW